MQSRAWTATQIARLAAMGLIFACACGDNNNNASDAATPVPTPTVTAPPQIPCPQLVTYIVEGDESDFDAGWTGVYADRQLGTGGSLTFAVDCPGEFLGGCGECPISGPVASTTVVDNHRCANSSSVICTTDADCPGSTCSFFFGAPVPVSGGGVPICVTNRVTNDATGVIVPELGSGDSDLDIELQIFNGIAVNQPCPVCSGPAFDAPGTCAGGPRDGEACTVHGTTALGNTSFDCPPNPSAVIGTTQVPLDPTTGTRTLEPGESCTGFGQAGSPCYCAGQVRPNACLDSVCTIGADDEGTCMAGPIDMLCATEPFRGCLTDADCSANDTCLASSRKCSGETDATGTLTGGLTRTGVPSTELAIQVSAFCIDATGSPSVNAAAGLPGPAAVRLPTAICIFPSCP